MAESGPAHALEDAGRRAEAAFLVGTPGAARDALPPLTEALRDEGFAVPTPPRPAAAQTIVTAAKGVVAGNIPKGGVPAASKKVGASSPPRPPTASSAVSGASARTIEKETGVHGTGAKAGACRKLGRRRL